MKKLLILALAAVLALSTFTFTGCTARKDTLRIYNWGEYMSRSTYKGFEKWYKAKTNKKIKVEYREFSTNESMLNSIKVKESDYDLVCPSDYMVQRMIAEELLIELSEETRAIIQASIREDVYDMSKSYDPESKYAMPYLWGTVGIMYNENSGFTEDQMNSWDVLWNTDLGKKSGSGRVYMKDSVRDSYSVAMLNHYSPDLQAALDANDGSPDSDEYRAILEEIFVKIDDAKIEIAKNLLLAQKNSGVIRSYEVDNAKDEMQRDPNGDKGYYGMFWSCDAGYIMNEEESAGCGNGVTTIPSNMKYIVPTVGSNVWVDNFVIPKHAVNVDAANYFIQYLCEMEQGYDCMDFAGCTSAVAEAIEEYQADLEADEDFFKGTYTGFKEMYLEMMFPGEEVIQRCAIMADFGEEYNDKLNEMWLSVRAG